MVAWHVFMFNVHLGLANMFHPFSLVQHLRNALMQTIRRAIAEAFIFYFGRLDCRKLFVTTGFALALQRGMPGHCGRLPVTSNWFGTFKIHWATCRACTGRGSPRASNAWKAVRGRLIWWAFAKLSRAARHTGNNGKIRARLACFRLRKAIR